MKQVKKMGISVEFMIGREDDKDMTEEQLDSFLDEFVELVEKHNYYCGGGMGLIDLNSDETEKG